MWLSRVCWASLETQSGPLNLLAQGQSPSEHAPLSDRGARAVEQPGPNSSQGGSLGALQGSPLSVWGWGGRSKGHCVPQRPACATRLVRVRGRAPVGCSRRCGWTEHAAYMERMGATSSREAIRIPISQMQAVSSRAHVGSPLALPWPKTWEQDGERGT